jgi:hypothetical protein
VENAEHLVLVLMRVPGELALDSGHLDVLIVDLPTTRGDNHSLRAGHASSNEIDTVWLLGGDRLIAETGADGDLVTAFGAAAAEDGGACLGLHAREEAVGLGAVAAVRLKGTLRHDKNSCGRRRLLLKLLAIAAISEYT